MTDVVDKIEQDHRAVEALFAEFKRSSDRTIADRICDELEQHTKAEEDAVYPVMKSELRQGDEEIAEAEHEHADAKQLIAQIRATDDQDTLVSLMGELESAIQHHVHEEESELLPQAREELPSDELEELGEKFDEAKADA
jgi:iron-sulfur cluster repair protein YtfE (RIC family)